MAEGHNTLTIIVLIIALAAVMATVCFGLSVLLINVVDKLWPPKGFSKSEKASKSARYRSDAASVQIFRKAPAGDSTDKLR
jgi:hypothetical protein